MNFNKINILQTAHHQPPPHYTINSIHVRRNEANRTTEKSYSRRSGSNTATAIALKIKTEHRLSLSIENNYHNTFITCIFFRMVRMVVGPHRLASPYDRLHSNHHGPHSSIRTHTLRHVRARSAHIHTHRHHRHHHHTHLIFPFFPFSYVFSFLTSFVGSSEQSCHISRFKIPTLMSKKKTKHSTTQPASTHNYHWH